MKWGAIMAVTILVTASCFFRGPEVRAERVVYSPAVVVKVDPPPAILPQKSELRREPPSETIICPCGYDRWGNPRD
jgi:hypothetical protein